MKIEDIKVGARIYSYYFWSERQGTVREIFHYEGYKPLGFPAKDYVVVKWDDWKITDHIEPQTISEYPPSNGSGMSYKSLADKCRDRITE